MNLQSMEPHPFDGSWNTFPVTCTRCGDTKSSSDVVCDLDDKPGTFYCGHCCTMVVMGLPVHPRNLERN